MYALSADVKRSLAGFFLIAFFTLFSTITSAYPVVGYATSYTSGSSGVIGLWKIDFSSGDVQLISGLSSLTTEKSGLAINSKNQLFAMAEGGTLTEIDPASGTESFIGSSGGSYFGADFYDDILVSARSDSVSPTDIVFSTIDTSDASRTDFLTLNDIGPIGGMALLDPTTAFFTANSALYTTDLSSGIASKVGDLGAVWWGLDFGHDGYLYGLGDTGIYRVDPFTAAETLIVDASSQLDGALWMGLAITTPVPEPASITLLGMGLALFGFKLRRKNRG